MQDPTRFKRVPVRSSAASITLDSIDLLLLSGDDLVVKTAASSIRAFVVRGGGVLIGTDVRWAEAGP